jgi:hypothetical protein
VLGEELAAGASLGAKKTRGVDILCSPSLAAAMALSFDASEELPIKFFQEVLGLTRFGENDLQVWLHAFTAPLSTLVIHEARQDKVSGVKILQHLKLTAVDLLFICLVSPCFDM